jgi:serine/threonine protein phosphatase 1
MKLSEYVETLKDQGLDLEKTISKCKTRLDDSGVEWTANMETIVKIAWETFLSPASVSEIKSKGTRWVIGDIHGCLGTLKALVKKIKYHPGVDSLYFTGDYIDRGPSSKEVIDYIMALQTRAPKRVIPLLGNHEKMLLDALEEMGEKMWVNNGGKATLESFGVDHAKEIPAKYLTWFHRLKLFANTSGYAISHAGLNLAHPDPYRATETNMEHILWNRDSGGYDPARKITLVCGHTPKSLAEIRARLPKAQRIYIDGGCCYNGFLVSLNLETRSIVTQKCIDIVGK